MVRSGAREGRKNCDPQVAIPIEGIEQHQPPGGSRTGGEAMLRCLLWALAAAVQPKALLIADNLCLRQQLVVLQRRKPRPRLEDVDRRFWIPCKARDGAALAPRVGARIGAGAHAAPGGQAAAQLRW